MNRYPGNHVDSGIVTLPRQLKTRPGAPQTHLAYITGDEARMLQEHKPGTPHEGAAGIPNYDAFDMDTGSYYSSEQLDYGTSGGSTLGGGTAHPGGGSPGGGNNPPPSMMTDWSGSISNADAYTEPNEIYGQGTVGPGETYEWTPHNTFYNSLIQNLSPETLNFWGINENSQTIPVELYQQLMEGMIVSGNEAELSPEWGVGTWNELESGNHPGFEWLADQMGVDSGLDLYYDIMGQPTITPDEIFNTTGGGSGNNPGGPSWGSWGGSNLNYGNIGGGGKYADWGNRPFMTQNFNSPMPQYYSNLRNTPRPKNQEMFKNMMANMYRV